MTGILAGGEPFDSLVLSLSKDELADGRLVEPRAEPLILRQAQDERMYQTVTAPQRWGLARIGVGLQTTGFGEKLF
jgi:hypothetical protein